MIGEADGEAELSKRSVRSEHAFASGADAEAMHILADAFADGAPEDAREIDGMDAGFEGEFVEGKATAVLVL